MKEKQVDLPVDIKKIEIVSINGKLKNDSQFAMHDGKRYLSYDPVNDTFKRVYHISALQIWDYQYLDTALYWEPLLQKGIRLVEIPMSKINNTKGR